MLISFQALVWEGWEHEPFHVEAARDANEARRFVSDEMMRHYLKWRGDQCGSRDLPIEPWLLDERWVPG